MGSLRRRSHTSELEELKYALDQSAIVAITDTRGTITYANDRFCEISKYPREELLGWDHRIINSGYHPKAFMRDLWETIESGKIWRGEIRNRAKDGTVYWVDTTIVPFLATDGRPYQYMAIRYETTERKLAEERLREREGLARLGQMAAIIAHEVKNPLAGIKGALQVVRGSLPKEGRDHAIFGDIIARLDSLNEMVQDLLLFSRPRTPKPAPISLRMLVDRTAALLVRDSDLAKVEVVVEGDDVVAHADPAQLQHVFQNVLLNAAQAMDGQGRIRVALSSVAGGRCEVVIADEGPGIPQEVHDRAFEPFVTTKHRGSGLGLAIAKQVVELHHGEISVESTDAGATIRVQLPAG
ncbi:MAG TPA: hypothetical protein DCP38_08115 [Acidobacteria bacterium]|jgi:two-component system CheB/CheR fusion protein|nr:hypothetical protein [Acidobacteriota bacterium]MDP6371077.1 ATP-binding protein [Vicinamibacterales bacterium]HAK55431.1 hypothetical protein [Acidobacteriota bacterium]|tara:strand:- start:4691 stop:5752 length:1062 start_codon:yes stop_codon:yes gene_type:complete